LELLDTILKFLQNDNSKKTIIELINNLPENKNVFNIYKLLQNFEEKNQKIEDINIYELYKTNFSIFI
jgi:uncharacterized LabA/DUF88 family protein